MLALKIALPFPPCVHLSKYDTGTRVRTIEAILRERFVREILKGDAEKNNLILKGGAVRKKKRLFDDRQKVVPHTHLKRTFRTPVGIFISSSFSKRKHFPTSSRKFVQLYLTVLTAV